MSARQRKATELRAHKRASKQAAKRKAHRHSETPRNARQRATQTPTLGMFAKSFRQKFTAALLRERSAA